MKKVIVVHGWGGSPEANWLPAMGKELENMNMQSIIPEMPNTDFPIIEEWVDYLEEVSENTDKDTYFIGHSVGCQAILRFLETEKNPIGGILLIAPWFNLIGMESEEEEEIAQPWIETPINFQSIKKVCPKITAIFSDDDPCVPLSEVKQFKEKLNAKTLIIKQREHFTSEDELSQTPEIMKEIKLLVGVKWL